MIIPGEIVELPVVRVDETGCWLQAKDEELRLHGRDVLDTYTEGTTVKVFVYISEELEKMLTTQLPDVVLNQAGCSRVVGTGTAGAFIDIGSRRDIVIPSSEQRRNLKTGDKVAFVMKYDFEKRRLYGTTYFTSKFKNLNIGKEVGDQVEAMVVEKLGFGRRLVVENACTGLLYTKDIMRPLRLGDKLKLYIKEIGDREMILSMQKIGQDSLVDAKKRIMNLLEQHQGYLRLSSNTDSDEIKMRLRMGKNTFKKAAHELSEEGKIVLTKRGIKTKK